MRKHRSRNSHSPSGSPPMDIRRASLRAFLLGTLIVSWMRPGPAAAADQAQVQQAITKGTNLLRSEIDKSGGGQKSLIAVALIKAKEPPASPAIRAAVDAVLAKIQDGAYEPPSAVHIQLYEAGVDAMLLADAVKIPDQSDPAYLEFVHPYKEQLAAITRYILSYQLSSGAWDYPPGHPRGPSAGDTSVTQYAMLGLWAAARAGVEIDPTVWERTIEWHIGRQNRDGGFAYVPGTDHGFGAGRSTLNMTINAVGSTYIALMHLNPGNLPDITDPKIAQPAGAAKKDDENVRFGVLEKVDVAEVDDTDSDERPQGKIPPATGQLLAAAYNWIVPRFRPENDAPGYDAYYYYSLERMAALARMPKIGEADWFNVCADYLIQTQEDDGGWGSSAHVGVGVNTAFAVLFLTRSTAQVVGTPVPADPIGGGLQKGGRGLSFDGLGGEKPKQPLAELDDLLDKLSAAGDFTIEEVQEQIVKQVQIGDKEALIERKDLLVEYVQHPDAEVRRTAVWALGRTNDLSLAKHLITALDDQDLGVIIEARNALCWLSRKPTGLGEAADPFEDLPEDATAEQRSSAIAAWHAELIRKWGEWYLEHRPYKDRGDEFEANLLRKIAEAGG
ncbi:MAG: hypothetical protein DWQ45_02270 [Planctomycetota bacterium]|nr:MAG: hypothetical protein DWQ41_00230 [Planctomycetota bacterium]REK39039.1 MAG: hypothetical protein DWQ45_02270 [Planctomycetota bacterium]